MRNVFTNNEVPHVWAQQRQQSGRSGFGNVFFEGAALYSYGSHFLTGYIMPDGVALLNSSSYSISTSKHQSRAAGAVRHRTTYRVPDLTAWEHDLGRVARDMRAKRGTISRDHAKRLRARIEAAALHLNDDTGAYLSGLARAKWSTIKAKAQRKADVNAKRYARHALKTAKQLATDYGTRMSDKQFAQRLQYIESVSADYERARQYKDLKDDLFEAHKHGAAGRPKVRAILWRRLKAVRAAMNGGAVTRSLRYREGMKWLRTLRAGLDANQQPASYDKASRWFIITQQVEGLLGRHLGALTYRMPPATRAKLEQLERDASNRALNLQTAEEREAFEAAAEKRNAWLRGEGYHGHGLHDERGGALLRATDVERDADGTITDGTLETSQGARVPLVHAIRAFRFVKLCHDTGRQWSANGRTVKVGHYRIDRIEPSGDFVAGCHRINWGEVERLAIALGVFQAPASEEALEPSSEAA